MQEKKLTNSFYNKKKETVKVQKEETQDEEVKALNTAEELSFPLHKVFVDISLENDLKGEELEWFKSKICTKKIRDKNKKKPDSGLKKVEIITEYKSKLFSEKPNKLLLKLSETDTIWFLSLDTCFSQDSAEDAERIRQENETYKMKKTKKEIIRKRTVAEAQTPCFIVKSKETLTADIVLKNALIFTSEWDMYDTYNALDKHQLVSSKKYLKFEDPSRNRPLTGKVSREEQAIKTFGSLSFKYSSLVMERLLASNCFHSQQSIFKKDYKARYYTGPSQFTYNAEPLWSFQLNLEHPLTVTDMDWNPLNEDLLAVGYGDLNFEKGYSGLICVWSSKNPRQPERLFHFEDSVTSLHFSRVRPNMLASGTCTGNVFVLDVSTQEGNIRILERDGLKTKPGPVWKVEWLLYNDLTFITEELLVIGESGVLMVFTTSIDKDFKDILKLEYVTTTPKCVEKLPSKKCNPPRSFHYEVFGKKIFSGLSFSLCSERKFCYISTKEGVIVKCNLRNPSMRDGVFLAHDGPVYTILHSPLTDLVYLTCGADWKIKIWMEGITQPLITLQQKTPVTCVKWSPTIPTLIASIGGSELSLWDINRNILFPMSTKNLEDSGKSLSTLLFSSNGANLIVGCENGLVQVIHLTELPRIPFLQKEALISAIKKVLLRNKNELFWKFCRAVEANKENLKTKILKRTFKNFTVKKFARKDGEYP